MCGPGRRGSIACRLTGAAAAFVFVLPVHIASAAPFSRQVAAGTDVQAAQDQVITANHRPIIGMATFAVDAYTTDVTATQNAIAVDHQTAAGATLVMQAADRRLVVDQADLGTARVAEYLADRAVAADQDQLQALAIGAYTGESANPIAQTFSSPSEAQSALFAYNEVSIVADDVEYQFHHDLGVETAAVHHREAEFRLVTDDRNTAAAAVRDAQAAAARIGTDTASLNSYEGQLSVARYRLAVAQSDLQAALAAVANPSSVPVGQVSLLGGSALSAGQLVAWYNSQGYVDLTGASINQLASWYIQSGQETGVRGDVAFAQAVLETGGFSSDDAVTLSNFAGIGHCDTCAAGWAFPSPQGGVLGQVQLLYIFADKGPSVSGAPAPVLPQLTVANQFEAGCCDTISSLTGVWATDPTYGTQITSIYSSILSFTLGRPTA